jgi:hypothetical protein
LGRIFKYLIEDPLRAVWKSRAEALARIHDDMQVVEEGVYARFECHGPSGCHYRRFERVNSILQGQFQDEDELYLLVKLPSIISAGADSDKLIISYHFHTRHLSFTKFTCNPIISTNFTVFTKESRLTCLRSIQTGLRFNIRYLERMSAILSCY